MRELTDRIAELEEEREALCASLENAALWHDSQDKAISKQPNANHGHNGWMRSEHQEQAALLRKAIAQAVGRV